MPNNTIKNISLFYLMRMGEGLIIIGSVAICVLFWLYHVCVLCVTKYIWIVLAIYWWLYKACVGMYKHIVYLSFPFGNKYLLRTAYQQNVATISTVSTIVI